MMYPMLPVSQDCSVWCTLCCQFLRIVVYGVPYVASFSGSSIFNYPTILSNVYLMCLPPIILICPYLSDKQLLYKRETTLSMKNRFFFFFFFTKVTIAFQFVFAFIQVWSYLDTQLYSFISTKEYEKIINSHVNKR